MAATIVVVFSQEKIFDDCLQRTFQFYSYSNNRMQLWDEESFTIFIIGESSDLDLHHLSATKCNPMENKVSLYALWSARYIPLYSGWANKKPTQKKPPKKTQKNPPNKTHLKVFFFGFF